MNRVVEGEGRRGATGPDVLDILALCLFAHLSQPTESEAASRSGLAEYAEKLPDPGFCFDHEHRFFERWADHVFEDYRSLGLSDSREDFIRLGDAIDFAIRVAWTLYKGQRPRIRKRRDYPKEKAQRLGRLLLAGVKPEDAFAQLGIPRSTGYRLLKRPNNQ